MSLHDSQVAQNAVDSPPVGSPNDQGPDVLQTPPPTEGVEVAPRSMLCEECIDSKPAAWWCDNCKRHLCDDCHTHHKRSKRTHTHTTAKIIDTITADMRFEEEWRKRHNDFFFMLNFE